MEMGWKLVLGFGCLLRDWDMSEEFMGKVPTGLLRDGISRSVYLGVLIR